MLDEGVESRSDGDHRIHWTRIDSKRKVHHEGVESRSDGVRRIHWKRIDSDGKVYLSIGERFRKFRSCCMRG